MKLNRTRNTINGIVSGIINKCVTLLLPFIVRSLLIYRIGADYAGLNGLFTSILQVLNIAELGFSTAVVYSMYKPIADGDDATICALLRFYRGVYRCVGVFILTAGLCVMPFLPYLIEGAYPADINLYLLYFIFLLNTAIGYLLYAYKASLFNAYQRVDIINTISTLTQGLLSGLQIIIIFLTGSYYLYVVMIPLATVANNLLLSHEVNKMFPQYKCYGQLSQKLKASLKKQMTGLIIQRACGATRSGFDNIFISAFLGLTVIAIYTNYYLIISSVTSIMMIITTSMTAGIGNSMIQESKESNYRNMRRFNFMYMWIAGWFTATLFSLYQPFMKLWMGQDLMFDLGAVSLFCLYFYALKMGDINSTYYSSAGLWWFGKYRAVAESALNLILNFVLIQLWGVYGVIAGTLISLFLVNFLYGGRILYEHYFSPTQIPQYYREHFFYALAMIANCAITYFICLHIAGSGILHFLALGCVCTIVPNLFFALVYCKYSLFHESVVWIKEHCQR